MHAKRAVFNRRGDGVHSPYAFEVIRQVFRNPYPYTAFAPLGRQLRTHRASLRTLYGDRLVSSPRIAELIFRLVHRHSRGEVLLIAPQESLLPHYLQATGKASSLTQIATLPCGTMEALPTVVVAEDWGQASQAEIQAFADSIIAHRGEQVIVLHRHNPFIGRELRYLRQVAQPEVVFDTLDIEVWVWRKAITPGRYKVHY